METQPGSEVRRHLDNIEGVLSRQHDALMAVLDVLQDCRDYLNGLSDCEIIEGRYRPNRALQLVNEIDEALAKIGSR